MVEQALPANIGALGIPALVELIEHHNHCYWVLGEPEISDDDYERLVMRLRELDPIHPLIHQLHTPAVASDGKVRHSRPMLSLDKAYSLEEVLEWAGKYARNNDELLLVQPKYDGISANFSGGVLATRGDGVEGEDITAKLPLIRLEAPDYQGPVNRPVRGEIVIRDDVFREKFCNITRKDGGTYKNSRNAVAGIMGLKEIDDILAQFKTHDAWLSLVDYGLLSFRVGFGELRERWPEMLHSIEEMPYPMDGIVIKFADEDYSLSLGYTAHHPRGQIAFKFSGIRKTSTLLDVQWSFGKNCLTPVAEIEPVDIGGITIKHASLHNCQNIIDKDIHIGDIVTVERAGDVIPYIVSSEPGAQRRPCLIQQCPCCDSTLIRKGPELCCVNPECSETRLQRLAAAVRNIGIERLGEPNIRRMMQTLNVKSLKDIFALTAVDILKLEGFKEKSAANLLKEIDSARRVNDYQLLASLNIPGIGVNIARQLLAEYSLEQLASMDRESLSAIHGIGPERANALFVELQNQQESIAELKTCVSIIRTKDNNPGDIPSVCFTGKMPEKRSYYEDIARARGLNPVDSVTAQLSLLVAADPSESSSKLQKAAKLGVSVQSLDQWLNGTPQSEQAQEDDKHGDNDKDDLGMKQGTFNF